MIAYSENELYNYHVRHQAHGATESGDISMESYKQIEDAYPTKLYTPHFFIAIAVGLLTMIAVLFTGILTWLLTQAYSSSGMAVLSAFMTVACYSFLEWAVKNKNYFNAGIDNVLMSLVLFFSAGVFLSYSDDVSWILFNAFLMLLALWLCLRFVDAFMAIVSCGFFLTLCFLLYLKSAPTAVEYFPFVIMGIIGVLYFFITKAKNKVKFVYEKCLMVLTIFLLLAFYAAGNYWVVNQLRSSITPAPGPIGSTGIFWIFTFLIPIVYIVYGIIKKEVLHLRIGLLLIAMTVFTYKSYYALLPVEIEMLMLGLLLIAISYFLIKWLTASRHGYSSQSIGDRPSWKNAESLIIGETMGGLYKTDESHLMDGGSGGGAGATGEY